MSTIAIDGLNEEDFRRSIENRLREDQAAAAEERLRRLIAPYAVPGGLLPERFLTVTAAELVLTGWEDLPAVLESHDRPGRPVTAISITFGWPGEDVPQPDADGRLSPIIETSYYNDDAFPFSKSMRNDLLEGYSYHGCSWSADCDASDSTVGLTGVEDLCGALARLEAELLASEEPDEDGIRAGSLGACLLSVLLYQTVRERVNRYPLPRPLCVMAGSNDVYPYFDAPVVGMPEAACRAAEEAEDEPQYSAAIPVPGYSSLLMANIPRGKKRAVLVLHETEVETTTRINRMRGLGLESVPGPPVREPEPEPLAAEPQAIIPMPGGPLMTKKPHAHTGDFRDLLGHRDFDPPLDEPPFSLEPEPAPEPETAPEPEPEPIAAALPHIEPTLQERLQQLLADKLEAPAAPVADAWPEPVAGPAASAEPEPLPEPEPVPVREMDCVRFSVSTLAEHLDAPPPPEPLRAKPTTAPAPKRGLIARFLAWINW